MDTLEKLEKSNYLCRLCLCDSLKFYPLFHSDDTEAKSIPISMKMSLCTTVRVSKFDSFSKRICSACYDFIEEWYKFRRRCIQTAATLKKMKEQSSGSVTAGLWEAVSNCEPVFAESSSDGTVPDAEVLNNLFTEKPHACDSMFNCNQCSASFSLLNELSLHKLTRHSQRRLQRGSKFPKESPKLNEEKTKKAKIAREKLNLECCGMWFTEKMLYLRHRELKHPSEKPYACDICGKRDFISSETLKRHKVLHTDRYACKVCGKSFTCHAILRIHVRDKHENDRPFICDICGKAYVTELLLSYHQRFHTGEKKFVCEECGVAVVTSSSLAKHKKIHSSIKPHICEICNKGFIVRGRLVEHMRIHTGERPFVCKICQKSFTMQDKLKRHVRSHLGQKLYSCEICGRGYTTCHGLSIHLKTHSANCQQ